MTKYGYAISRLAKLDLEKINEITLKLSSSAAGADICINKLLTCYLCTDISNFESTIKDFIGRKGLHSAITELIVPFIERAELFSYTDKNASSFFAINIAKNKIIAATEQLNNTGIKDQTLLLFLPLGQYFDLILIYISYQLQRSGFRIIYLGFHTPPESIGEIISKYKVETCVTYISPREKTNIVKLEQAAINFFNNTPLVIATTEKNNTHYNEIINRLTRNNVQAH